MERVVITGMGVVSPIGNDIKTFWNNLIKGESGIVNIDTFDVTNHKTKIAGIVQDFDADEVLGKKEARRLDRFSQFALAAAEQAWSDSKLALDRIDIERLGVYVGSGIGGIETLIENVDALRQKGPRRVSPTLVPAIMSNAAAAQISIKWNAMGPSMSPVSACAIGNTAIGEAFRLIRSGESDVIFAGGTESAITDLSIASFGNATALSTRNDNPTKASRPFDENRDGFVMSEGAGILILESLSHALRREAKIYAEVIGYGASSDAHHIVATHPEGKGAYLAMRSALKNANISPEEVDVISAHATSTKVGDISETMAIKQLFGKQAYQIPVTANKSMLGHMLGAAGGVEAIALAMSLKEGTVPPTINLENLDPLCDLDYVPSVARQVKINIGLSNSFGFGGHNAAIILKRYE
ncbi:beta-ketoacyl-acyl-carrier-protein synthase II [Bacillus cereus BAG1X2-3]|uniref:beta-ketoacyl-ACP synthase II n=1 Tax=Bacillus cereus TaxID=1396 RepID=UPI00032EB4A3|nr:beta-ketoacyl-ACP synthase II [Bacillus cereus]EOO24475.1 beta-ketoacyl-acyl-carrier-protein synthase II [Bacillus cereus BAG1X1-1]EOO43223.1 beta-ketoacyl-acyl-carrier-protein synthase II [Bacillus cereus BAG1X2-1]EOO45592.1 beta-ketoacyl-acyl-carrier-protein synthase II [Bacillus cereus BAG1X2-2]EOO62185.1 beta-ketoacyl-acyl-carrier-protein synthase II [Bacillus cereus BAG1X2-3]EOP01102.1 beta-ketoacyl-acyl-carrier-protein synthase II [Bacillus cereus BAG2O-1]